MTKTKKAGAATELSKVAKAKKKVVVEDKVEVSPLKRISDIAVVLRRYALKKAEESNDILQDECKKPIFLQINFNQSVEKADLKPLVIDLPNPLYKEGDHEVCLIVRKPQRLWKDKVAAEEKQTRVVTKVIDFDHLRKKFPMPENKRALMNDFDVFFADEKLLHLIPGQLGRHFVKAKKLPVGLPLRTTKSVQSILLPALSRTCMILRPGTTTSIKISYLSDSPSKIAENAMAVLKRVDEHIKKLGASSTPWKMVSVAMHLSGSISLPILQTENKA